MPDAIDDLIGRVIAREGGYVDNAADAGGPTKYGITLATLHDWRKAPVSAYDVAAAHRGRGAADLPRALLPGRLRRQVKDPGCSSCCSTMASTRGSARRRAALQTVLKRDGLYAGAIDGGFGPQVAAALAKVTNWPALFYAVKCERYELLMRYIGRRWDQAQFATGWANRNDQFDERIG
jgi:lysozyme family protein